MLADVVLTRAKLLWPPAASFRIACRRHSAFEKRDDAVVIDACLEYTLRRDRVDCLALNLQNITTIISRP